MKKSQGRQLAALLALMAICWIFPTVLMAARTESGRVKKKTPEELKKQELEQNEVMRREIMTFVKENPDRDTGEGWLYLAQHYKELKQPDQAMVYLRTLLRSDHIKPEFQWEAQLLFAEILEKDKKDYARALKELDRMISWKPEREFLVRAKIARAKLLGRNLTSVVELQKAFKRFYWPFPEKSDVEAIDYIMGFERGYDLEIAMRALDAWDEISGFSEEEAQQLAFLRIGMLHAFDLNNPERARPFFEKITGKTQAAIDAQFISAVLYHFYIKGPTAPQSMDFYKNYRNLCEDLDGYRISGIMQAQLACEKLQDYESAINACETVFTTPPHLIGSASISLEKRKEERDEEIDWALLACRMAGYIAEYRLNSPDRARSYYQKAKDLSKERSEPPDMVWIEAAMKRTEPQVSPAQMLFDAAFEKYRSRQFKQAIELYEEFISKYSDHHLFREALYRIAVMTDDDLRDYEEALKMYQRYIIRFSPTRSTWNLDVLYDWGRTDEVRYRIGNLMALHLQDPVGALEIFSQLAAIFPDSYWAQQGLKDSIEIYQDDLGDPDKANEMMVEFIEKYPESKDSSKFRLKLYGIFLQKGEQIKALRILRDYLDHELPSDREYFNYKQQWRDLAFRIREESLRKVLETAGPRDRIDTMQNLIEVLCLASSSVPLEGLVDEIKKIEGVSEETRWALVYQAGTNIYRYFPDKASPVFDDLAKNATGTPKIACHLTLGHIAYRVDKNLDLASQHYEQANKALPLTDPLNELPTYRLGRIYLAQGHGLKGMETLQQFVRRFPHSRLLGKAYQALGDASVALHSPEKAEKFYRRALRVAPKMAENLKKKLAELETMQNSQEWLKQRANDIRKISLVDEESEEDENAVAGVKKPVVTTDSRGRELPLDELTPEAIYELLLRQTQSAKPDLAMVGNLSHEILKREKVEPQLRSKALRHYISVRIFRERAPEVLNEEVPELLARHNYAEWQSELLFRLGQCREYFLNQAEEANKAYFEYLSFYPDGRRAVEARERIPRVFEQADDQKNAERFFNKLIEDTSVADEKRVDASIDLAKMQVKEEQKTEAIKTLEAALALNSKRKPEICLRLEKLTEDFSYVRRALDSEGEEEIRLKALKRLIEKAEEDRNYEQAAGLLSEFTASFTTPEATVWIEKKVEDLSKRGVISEIEQQIEQYPEEPETAGRMYKLARLVEGAENTRYRAQDLFYEITLVYPNSEFYKESRIRAENVRTIKAVAELSDLLKKGLKGEVGEEVIIERARLLQQNLKDLPGAMENYQSFIALFPDSPRCDEVYLAMGDIVLAENGSSKEALAFYEKALAASHDPFNREDITRRINDLQKFQGLVIYSDSEKDHQNATRQIYRIWRLEKNLTYALGLLENAMNELHNRPQVARFRYLRGRIFEESGQLAQAEAEYVKALRSLYHPGCRKDMLLYRLARLKKSQKKDNEAAAYYRALVHRYPRSMLSRSGLYSLYKYMEKQNNLTRAHHFLDRLLLFRALFPSHRVEMEKKLREIEARMNIEEMKKLKRYSKIGGTDLPYFIGKVLENNLRDFDRAIGQYEDFLKSGPSVRRSREIMTKIADLYEKKGDYVKAVSYLDMLLDTYEPHLTNFDLILRIGSMVEDKLTNPELTELFYSSIVADYERVPKVRDFAIAKLKRIEEKKRETARKPRGRKVIKRVYSEDDELVIEEMNEIIERQIDDLQDFKQAERQLVDLWDENTESLATLDIMKALVELNMKQLLDPDKASDYYQKWLDENPQDPLYKEITLKLYEHYMEEMQDGQRALRLLEDFIRDNPVSIETLDLELKLGKANELLIRNWDEARRIYQRIIDTKQNDPIVHEAYFRMGFVMRDGFANYDEAVKFWQELIDLFYNNEFSDKAQFAMAFTYETYQRDYTKARQNYEKVLNLYPNSTLQNDVRDALLRIEGK
ncbi:MAG: tetratricopeptide repeat protein [Candidatus Rifleibacteriota bacterium]